MARLRRHSGMTLQQIADRTKLSDITAVIGGRGLAVSTLSDLCNPAHDRVPRARTLRGFLLAIDAPPEAILVWEQVRQALQGKANLEGPEDRMALLDIWYRLGFPAILDAATDWINRHRGPDRKPSTRSEIAIRLAEELARTGLAQQDWTRVYPPAVRDMREALKRQGTYNNVTWAVDLASPPSPDRRSSDQLRWIALYDNPNQPSMKRVSGWRTARPT
jgi:transcriptional regulator with XRE-family HTH domain